MTAKQSTTGLAIAALGVALQAGFIVAALKIGLGLRNAASTLGISGIGDPTSLAGAIGEILEGPAAGLALGCLGLVLLCIALTGSYYRAGWFSWFLSVYTTSQNG